MIKHNSLEERLNAVKLGNPIPQPPLQSEVNFLQPGQSTTIKPMTYKQFFIHEGYKLFSVMSASILYGFGIKALFSTDWNFFGILGVGFLLNHVLTILLKSKLFKK
jgi:hypothetical protein